MLKSMLKQMVDDAGKKENVVIGPRKLKGNLHITLVMTAKNIQISLSRDKVYPSASEWKTTLDHFPYKVPQMAPRKFIDSHRRFAMRGELPRPDQVPQQIAFSGEQSAIGENLEPELDEKIQE